MDRLNLSRGSKNRWRILIVDNNVDTATALVYLLEIMGHQALYLFDARHALTKVDEFRPHVAFLELGMRTLDGMGLARLLREHYARHELRLVALSAYGDARTRNESMTADFDAYLAKPVKEHDVETVLSVVFDERLS
jgi:DNA-binding response OmpR family regulator